MGKYFRYLAKTITSPASAYSLFKALVRGTWYILFFRICRRKVSIRFPFLAYAKVSIGGPGKVFINSGCTVWMNSFEHLVITTLSPEAEVTIGKSCTLGGLTIRCSGKVILGNNILTAANLIQDVLITSPSPASKITSTIIIGNDVWLGGQSLILADSSIGKGAVIGVNGLLHHAVVKEDCLAGGNPVMRPVSIKRITRLRALS